MILGFDDFLNFPNFPKTRKSQGHWENFKIPGFVRICSDFRIFRFFRIFLRFHIIFVVWVISPNSQVTENLKRFKSTLRSPIFQFLPDFPNFFRILGLFRSKTLPGEVLQACILRPQHLFKVLFLILIRLRVFPPTQYGSLRFGVSRRWSPFAVIVIDTAITSLFRKLPAFTHVIDLGSTPSLGTAASFSLKLDW